MSSPFLITIPKYVPISPSPSPRVQHIQIRSAFSSGSSGSDDHDESGRGKKRRLDHLSWDEKVQRKKLKNRVAAQTSRDRKKAKMDDMEGTIKNLTEQTEILRNKCESLQAVNESLFEKNRKLDQQVSTLQKQLEQLQRDQKMASSALNCVGSESNKLNRSAVSNNPLPKGMESESTQCDRKSQKLSDSSVAALWKIVALCLVYKICLKTSTPLNWKSLPKAYSQISQQTWKQAFQKAAQLMPKYQAAQSDCLNQWWGPQQNSWNPAKLQTATAISA